MNSHRIVMHSYPNLVRITHRNSALRTLLLSWGLAALTVAAMALGMASIH